MCVFLLFVASCLAGKMQIGFLAETFIWCECAHMIKTNNHIIYIASVNGHETIKPFSSRHFVFCTEKCSYFFPFFSAPQKNKRFWCFACNNTMINQFHYFECYEEQCLPNFFFNHSYCSDTFQVSGFDRANVFMFWLNLIFNPFDKLVFVHSGFINCVTHRLIFSFCSFNVVCECEYRVLYTSLSHSSTLSITDLVNYVLKMYQINVAVDVFV